MILTSESELKNWFEENFRDLGYSKIIRRDIGRFPDFIMLKNNRPVKVELETLSSNFVLHKHNIEKVDEVVCIEKDIDLGVPIIEVEGLEYHSNVKRISATIDGETYDMIDSLLKNRNYRNKSHVIEQAILLLKSKDEKEK